MKTKLIKIIAIIIAAIGFFLPTSSVYAECSSTDICTCPDVPAEVRAASGCTGTGADVNPLDKTIINILNGIIAAVGLVALVFIVIGGINYTTSAGDAQKVKKAKDTILYACIGLIICALSYAIVNFVIIDIIS